MEPLLTAVELGFFHLIRALLPDVPREVAAAHARLLALAIGTLAEDEASQDEVWANVDVSLAELKAGQLPSIKRTVGL